MFKMLFGMTHPPKHTPHHGNNSGWPKKIKIEVNEILYECLLKTERLNEYYSL
jgi:hypothetical protein